MQSGSILCTIVVLLLVQADALNQCYQQNIQLKSQESKTISSPGYPYGFRSGSSCQFTVAAPIFHRISFNCTFYIGGSGSQCDPNDSLWYQPNGTPKLDTGYKYCGSNQQLSDQSMYNSVTMGHTTTYYSGYYSCSFQAVPTGCDCGQKTTTRIVGGARPAQNAYPYFAVLVDALDNTKIRGGATLISTTAAVTAAHVFISNGQFASPDGILLSVARDDVSKPVESDTPYSATYPMTYIPHPQYDDGTQANDIAVILTKTYILFNRGVNVICLPSTDLSRNYDDQRITEMGFGTTDYGEGYSKTMKSAGAYIMPNPQCKNTFNDLTDWELCTTNRGIDRNDTCQGDSGGPIVLSTYRDFIIGTVKDGIYCGGDFPGKCQKVGPYRSWVIQTAGTINGFCLNCNL